MLSIRTFLVSALLLSAGINSSHAAVILQYHHVSDTTPVVTSISPKLFKQHLMHLKDNNYQIWPLPKLVKHLKSHKTNPDKVVVITFDDAYDSIYQNAHPLLKKMDWPYTVFVSTDPIDKAMKGFMNWQQLKQLQRQGATIANHSRSHAHFIRRMTEETKAQWLTRIKKEILDADRRLEQELGDTHKLLAYPYGEFTQEIEDLVDSLGFVGFGQQSGAVSFQHQLTAIPRFPMNNNFGAMEEFAIKVASLPLAAAKTSPQHRIITSDDDLKDGLELLFHKVDGDTNQLRCYLSGHGKISLTTQEQSDYLKVRTAAIPPLAPGRSRLNCTMPSKERGRFYWHSSFWMRKLNNGEWYAEP